MNNKKQINNKVKQVINAFHDNKNSQIPSDTFGSYIGTTVDNEKPVQDADDI